MEGQPMKEAPLTESMQRAWELHKQFEAEITSRFPDLTPREMGEAKGDTATEVDILKQLRQDISETLSLYQCSSNSEAGLKIKHLTEAYVLLKGVVKDD